MKFNYITGQFEIGGLTEAQVESLILAATPDASTTLKGKVELATVAESEAGTDTARASTPQGVAAAIAALAPSTPDASTTLKGKIEIATQAEVDAASDTGRAVAPGYLRMRRDANGAISIGDLGGDARGADSVTIQAARASATRVASGNSATAVGVSTTASGNYATAIGASATASGNYATAIGTSATASALRATAIGMSTTASGNASCAIGYSATASGYFATASGYYTSASGYGSGAFGFAVRISTALVQELGTWSDYGTVRDGAVRIHGTGMVAQTIENRATAYIDGGATVGSEADNTILRNGFALRRNGNEILIDLNIAGTVTTLSLGTAA